VAVASAGPYANLHLDQTHNHASIPPLNFLQAGCPSCHPTNSIKPLKEQVERKTYGEFHMGNGCKSRGGGSHMKFITMLHFQIKDKISFMLFNC